VPVQITVMYVLSNPSDYSFKIPCIGMCKLLSKATRTGY